MQHRTLITVALSLLASCTTDMDGSGAGPEAPTQLTVAALSGGAHLTWKDNSTDEAHFMIERMKHGAGGYEPLASVPFNTTAYHDAPLVAGTVYMYRITAMNDDGESDSNEVSFTAP